MALTVVGFLMFFSVFLSALSGRGSGNFGLAPFGMILIVVGGLLRRAGARGLAGSGMILDPEQARDDLEPWARTAGGLVQDAIDESGLKLGGAGAERDSWRDLPLDERIRRLDGLRRDGLITDEEFEREKRELLDSN
ncbi:MAG: SHOCT domain-containing protein [Planctomycetota bacterium]